MSQENEQKKPSFKVEDKRRFLNDNDEQQTVTNFQLKDPPKSDDSSTAEEITLGSFIMSLATQGMMQLGEMPAPEGYPILVDLKQAKQTIDLIAMLQEKTKSHQDEFEQKLFEEILHSLRMGFVKKTSSSAKV